MDLHSFHAWNILEVKQEPALRDVDTQQRELLDKQWGSSEKDVLTFNSPYSSGASGSGPHGARVWLSPSTSAILIAAIFAGVTHGSKWSLW